MSVHLHTHWYYLHVYCMSVHVHTHTGITYMCTICLYICTHTGITYMCTVCLYMCTHTLVLPTCVLYVCTCAHTHTGITYMCTVCLYMCTHTLVLPTCVGLGTKLCLMFWGYASNMLKSPGLYPLGKPYFHSTLSLGKASPPFKPKALKVWDKSHLHSINPLIQSNTLSQRY